MTDVDRLETCGTDTLRAIAYKSKKILRGKKTATLVDHVSVLVGNKIYVLGGFSNFTIGISHFIVNHSVFVFDPVTFAWSRLKLADGVPFSKTLAMLVNDSIYLMCGDIHESTSQRTQRFDLVTQRLQPLTCVGNMLLPKFRAAGQYIEEIGMVIIVGDRFSTMNTHIAVGLHVESKRWTELKTKGRAPERIRRLMSCLHRKSDMYILGMGQEGQRVNYLLRCSHGQFTWHQPIWSSLFPALRYSVMTCVRNRIFITGGEDGTGAAKAELDVYDLIARKPHISRPTAGDRSPGILGSGKCVLPQGNPKRKAGHSVVVVDNKLFMIGGHHSEEWFLQVISP